MAPASRGRKRSRSLCRTRELQETQPGTSGRSFQLHFGVGLAANNKAQGDDDRGRAVTNDERLWPLGKPRKELFDSGSDDRGTTAEPHSGSGA